MSIQISNLAQSDLLQELNTADSSAVVGGHGCAYGYGGTVYAAPVASVSVPSFVAAAPGTASGIGVTTFSGGAGGLITTGVGFGSAVGGGFTAASGSSSSGAGGSIATGGGFTGGVANPINVTFDRV
jgi:hypothetical protein